MVEEGTRSQPRQTEQEFSSIRRDGQRGWLEFLLDQGTKRKSDVLSHAAKKVKRDVGQEADKKAARLKGMKSRRQLAIQRGADEEKAKLLEEERKMKEEAERRKKEREYDVELQVDDPDSIFPLVSPLLSTVDRWRSFRLSDKREEEVSIGNLELTPDSLTHLHVFSFTIIQTIWRTMVCPR